MNDRYLFRAKRIDTGEWTEGALFDGEKHCVIGHTIKFSPYMQNECKIIGHEVYRDTVCQCTGLKDRNGQLIWENDICIIENRSFDEEDGRFLVEWDNDDAMFELSGANTNAGFEFVHNFGCEVVGNVFDNPELLGNDDTGLER